MTTSVIGMIDAIIGELIFAEVGSFPPESDARLGNYAVMIDWDENGNFGGAYDLVIDDVRHNPGINIQRGKDSARPRSPAMVPSGSFELGNVHRLYSAENGSSPLFGLIGPDKPVKVSLQDVVNIDLITGAIDEPEQIPDRNKRAVGIRLLGKTAALKGREISTTLYQNIRTDEAVTIILDAVGWPPDQRAISSGDTVMRWWWLDDEDAWDALVELLETEGTGASMYESGNGWFHFENRNYRDMATRAMVSQGIYTESAPDDELAYQEFSYAPGMREIFNTVRITTVERALSDVKVVWNAGAPIVLSSNEVRTIIAEIDDPITAVQSLLDPTDIQGTGGAAHVDVSQISATKVAITFTAMAGGANLTGPVGSEDRGPQLRAQVAEVVAERDVTATSIGTVARPRTLSLTSGIRREISEGYAQSLCNVTLAFYQDPRPIISIEIMNASVERLAQIGTRDVSDRITVQEPITGVDRDIHIEQINHQVNVGGREHRCALIGSAAPDADAPGLWGVTTNGGWGTAKWAD